MDAMRWTILIVGVLVLIGIYALGRWRERRRQEAARAAEPVPGDPTDSAGGAGTDPQGAPGQGRRVVIDDDVASDGIEDLLADDELAPDGFDLGLGSAQEPVGQQRAAGSPEEPDTGVGGQGAAQEADAAERGRSGPAWQAEPAGSSSASSPGGDPSSEPAASGPAGGDPAAAGQSASGPVDDAPAAAGQPQAQGGAAGARSGGGTEQPAAGEPPPLRLPSASQVEIDAYRTGGVPEAEKLMLAFVAAGEGERFQGPDIEAALRSVRMVPGEHRAWHRRGESEAGPITLFSAANMVEPGYLDPEETLPGLRTPGLVFFMQLPLPVESEDVLEAMLATAYQVSVHLGGELLDRSRSTMTRQIAEHMREQLREHRRQLHIATHKRG